MVLIYIFLFPFLAAWYRCVYVFFSNFKKLNSVVKSYMSVIIPVRKILSYYYQYCYNSYYRITNTAAATTPQRVKVDRHALVFPASQLHERSSCCYSKSYIHTHRYINAMYINRGSLSRALSLFFYPTFFF